MTIVPDRSTFESAYAGQAPWDIGKPQRAFLDVADRCLTMPHEAASSFKGRWRSNRLRPAGLRARPRHLTSGEDEQGCIP
jgi:hypothetical protein